MYTLQPLPTIDSLNDHSGFYLICFCTLVWIIIASIKAETKEEFIAWLLGCGVFLGIAALISWNAGDIKVPKNEKLIGTFVGYQAEGFNIPVHSGKTTKRVDHHFVYVVYSIPNTGNVLFQASTGQHYPNKAIIYRN